MTKLISLLRDSPIPLYQQLLNDIRARIASGEWQPGTRLPTEAELAAELSVSRVTIRQALSAAVEANLVIRIPGKGTYVAQVAKTPLSQGFIGYVVPHLSSSFNVQTLLGVESVIKTAGYQLIFCNSEGDLEEENQLLTRLESEGMAGYVMQPIYSENKERSLFRLVTEGSPLVLIDRDIPGAQADVVTSDHFEGGYAVVRHLIDQGFTDIRYLARHPLDLMSIAERYRAYQAVMTKAGLPAPPAFVVGGPTELGYQNSLTMPGNSELEAIVKFLQGPERPQAIVAMNDLYALLVLMAAEQVGLSVPEDLAVVGFDDLDFAATLNPPLTTVAQQPYQLGMEAARLLLAWINGERGPVRQIRLPTRLVVRESSIRSAEKRLMGDEALALRSSH